MLIMKHYLLPLLLAASITATTAQPKPAKEKPPTQKDVQDMFKQAQKMMDEMDPDTKKMMDSLGIKMPDMKNIKAKMGGMTDAQLQKGWEDANRIVPAKNTEAIARVNTISLTASSLPAYLAAIHSKVAAALKPAAKTQGDGVYETIKQTSSSKQAIGNTAATLWMAGKAQVALYVMGKACIDNPADDNSLNNYAAMLSMAGGEQLALPILNKINKSHTGNSTILNNLGQAWFGLGDMDKAGKYIDSTLRIFPGHAQANFTKCYIEQSKGNTQGAVSAMVTSIKNGYSREKEGKLNELGYKYKGDEAPLPFKPNPDPLGLGSFVHPPFPKSVAESIIYKPLWDDFRQKCQDEMDRLDKVKQDAANRAQTMMNQQAGKTIQSINTAMQTGTQAQSFFPVPFFANRMLAPFKKSNDYWSGMEPREVAKVADYMATLGPLQKAYEADIKQLQKEDNEQTGEGKPNVDFCPKYRERADKLLTAYNPGLEKAYNDFLAFEKRHYSEALFYMQYIDWPEAFEAHVAGVKQSWLLHLKEIRPKFITDFNCREKETDTTKGGKLAEFDDVHCEYHSTLKLAGSTISVDCSRMTTELDLKFIKLGMKQDMNKETFGDQFMNGSVELGLEHSIGISDAGPLKAEASVGVAGRVEFDRNGITDIILKGSAGVSAGTNVIEAGEKAAGTKGSAGSQGVTDLTVSVGVEGKVSLISGNSSIEGTGFLQGVKP